ncbi:unnamed protein product [Leptidea sinapis]|uniref:28S ribosomal protein S27, mitochondrial n=1 Tax=Leptidea sinapis TaxID=189913 RepID=A0A5E4PN47_9NEOP|nr:unnamed protein product [Leptidea sinapis]
MMSQLLRRFSRKYISYSCRRHYLTNEYKCVEAWNNQINSPLLSKVNLNDFYNALEQNYSSKGVISAIDVDVFANAIRDPIYLDELRDLLHKLRLSGDTGNTLESTHHATARNFLEFGNLSDLVTILKDPLNFGVFLDFYTANLILDKLLTSEDYQLAANVAHLIMLQEEFSNDITCTLCQYACYKFLKDYKEPESDSINVTETKKSEKVEEIKIRIKFLRNEYYDDHFDIKDVKILSGKTLAWISKQYKDNVSNNLQLLGWLYYKKYDKLQNLCQELSINKSFKLNSQVIDVLKSEISEDSKESIENCLSILNQMESSTESLEEAIKLFENWTTIREEKLEEQTQRLNRAERIKQIEEKQKELETEEQKLWFFENEEQIDLQIEEKTKVNINPEIKNKSKSKDDSDYIPPEILPKRK